MDSSQPREGKEGGGGNRDGRADRQLIFGRVSACFADGAFLSLIFLGFFLVTETAVGDTSEGRFLLVQAARLNDLMIPYFILSFFLCFVYFTLFHFFFRADARKDVVWFACGQ